VIGAYICLQVNDIHQADACKVTPAKFSGSKEVVPLHFRRLVSPLYL
jgi:cation-transporting ATPase 13A1